MAGYSENEAGEVVLTMSRDSYEQLLVLLGTEREVAHAGIGVLSYEAVLTLTNRLNQGNPRFQQYEICKCVHCGESVTDPEQHRCGEEG
jgi:hypothetical protein